MTIKAQRSFAKGELTPSLYPRTDLAAYAIGLRTCRNFVVMRQGGIQLRPGLAYVSTVKDSTQPTRLLPFKFNISDTLVMEFGNQYIRFYQNGAPVVVSNVAGWNSGTAYKQGDLVAYLGNNYYCITANTNNVPPNGTYWYKLTGIIYEIPTPYVTGDLPTLNLAQSGDIVTLVHPNYPPAELQRFGDTDWVYVPIVFAPSAATPTGISVTGTVDLYGHAWQYAVTAIDDATGEESLPDIDPTIHAWADPTLSTPHTVTWSFVAGASTYNVYVAIDKGNFGFLGTANSANLEYLNTGQSTPDYATTPPVAFTDFTGAKNYPSVFGYYQQRAIYAATLNNPSRVWASQVGNYHYFNQATPIIDSAPIVATLASDEIDQIEHLVVIGKVIIGTQGAEWLLDGDPNGVLTPTSVNDRVGSYNGASTLRPVKVDSTLLYVQALSNTVLALKVNILYGYYTFQNEDLTLFSTHLFKGFTIVDWAYQKDPNYVVWVVRSDGALLSFTYVPDQQLSAWTRHDTQGKVESICVVPENNSDAVYVVVNRTIQGYTKRYIERMASLDIIDPVADPMFVDSALEYDGRNQGVALGASMTLSGGTDWTYDEALTLTASAAAFTTTMVGTDAIFLRDASGKQVTFTISEFIDGQHVIGFPNITVPVDMRNTALTDWDHAVSSVGNLSTLEAEALSVYADGFVVASPNNPNVDQQCIVSGGKITLDKPYAHIWAGLPYIGDIETLDIDLPDGESLKDTKTMISRIGLYVEQSRGSFVGPELPDPTNPDPLDGLDEIKFRDEDDDLTQPPPSRTTYMFANVAGRWNKTGRGVVRHVDPIPLHILAILPQGDIPDGR